jgi:hypothetical protein
VHESLRRTRTWLAGKALPPAACVFNAWLAAIIHEPVDKTSAWTGVTGAALF